VAGEGGLDRVVQCAWAFAARIWCSESVLICSFRIYKYIA
jgi:hypothetical protein